MRNVTKLVAGVFLAAPVLLASDLTGWDKVSDSDGIIVYQKGIEGSDTISIRAETVIDASVADIADVMGDNNTAAAWMPMITDRHDIKAIGPTERIEYTHIGMPWPLTDRYFINTGKAEYLPKGVVRLSVKSVEHPDPAWLEPDKVLGVLHYSEFLLTPRDGGQSTHMTIEVNTDPKGLIPSWLVNIAQKSWPRDFVTALRGQLEQRGKLHSKPEAVAH